MAVDLENDGEPDRASLRFSVRDSGIGIPPDKKQALIFHAFTQQDTARRRRSTGARASGSRSPPDWPR